MKLRRFMAFALAALLLCGAVALPASAADTENAERIIRSLGIMTADGSGSLNLAKTATRAEFSKMLLSASAYKDSVGTGAGSSPFKDVKYTHWASDYIKTAVDAGYMSGYVDGTFRPDSPILFEDAAGALLKLLGYTSADLSGTYPQAQIAKFRSLKLDEGLSLAQGKALTRNDCMLVFLNLMDATTKDGKVYATTLGYAVNADGKLDYDALVDDDLEGPFVHSGSLSSLPFAPEEFYRNGKAVDPSAVQTNDVCYYSETARTLWAYSDVIIGVCTAVTPSSAAPESVTVAGVTYAFETSAAKNAFASKGEFGVGDTVALLLGRTGEVAAVKAASEFNTVHYGIVISNGVDAATGAADGFMTVACTDGAVRRYDVGFGASKSVGTIVSAGYKNGELTVTGLSTRSLSGTVAGGGRSLGDKLFASNVEILDTTKDGAYKVVYPTALSGAKLQGGHVRHYLLNAAGEISHLILNDVTGDLETYGYVTSAGKTSVTGLDGSVTTSNSYSYLIDGKAGTKNTTVGSIAVGGAEFTYEGGAVSKIKNLRSVTLSSVGPLTAVGGNQSFRIADEVQVYLKSGESFYLLTLDDVDDLEKYILTGFYDEGHAAGGALRVILATVK